MEEALAEIHRQAAEATQLLQDGRRGAALETAIRLRQYIEDLHSDEPAIGEELRAVEAAIKQLQPPRPTRGVSRRHLRWAAGLGVAALLLAAPVQRYRLASRFPDAALFSCMASVGYREQPLTNYMLDLWKPSRGLPPRLGRVLVLEPPSAAAWTRIFPSTGPDAPALDSVFYALPADLRADTAVQAQTVIFVEPYRVGEDRVRFRLQVYDWPGHRFLGSYYSQTVSRSEQVDQLRDWILSMPTEGRYLVEQGSLLAHADDAPSMVQHLLNLYGDPRMVPTVTLDKASAILKLQDREESSSKEDEHRRLVQTLGIAGPLVARLQYSQLTFRLEAGKKVLEVGVLHVSALPPGALPAPTAAVETALEAVPLP